MYACANEHVYTNVHIACATFLWHALYTDMFAAIDCCFSCSSRDAMSDRNQLGLWCLNTDVRCGCSMHMCLRVKRAGTQVSICTVGVLYTYIAVQLYHCAKRFRFNHSLFSSNQQCLTLLCMCAHAFACRIGVALFWNGYADAHMSLAVTYLVHGFGVAHG